MKYIWILYLVIALLFQYKMWTSTELSEVILFGLGSWWFAYRTNYLFFKIKN